MRRMIILKVIENRYYSSLKINHIHSPNYSHRRKNTKVDTIIIHYTGMKSKNEAIDKLIDPKSKVSAHWLICENRIIYKLVDECFASWHAGKSFWKGRSKLNEYSIGIELVNPGHANNYRSFGEKQIKSLEELLARIFKDYKLDIYSVLAHSDIAPDRKMDPGELFDWQRLAQRGLAYWPKIALSPKAMEEISYEAKCNEVMVVQNRLKKIGYKINVNGIFNYETKLVISAFQRRFLQNKVDGILCGRVYSRVEEVLSNIS